MEIRVFLGNVGQRARGQVEGTSFLVVGPIYIYVCSHTILKSDTLTITSSLLDNTHPTTILFLNLSQYLYILNLQSSALIIMSFTQQKV